MVEETPEQKTAREAAEAATQKKFEGLDPETQKFVKDLREEAKTYRLKLQSLEGLQKEFEGLKKKQADAEAAALTEQGKHKELAEQYKKELDTIKPEIDRLKAIEVARHKALLEKLPEDARDKYKDVSTDILEDVVTRFLGQREPLIPKKPGEDDPKFYTKEQIKAMTQDEIRANLKKVNESLAHF